MKKIFLEAQYRIKDKVFNDGYICIYKDLILGIFTMDCVSIGIVNGHIYFNLAEYEPNNNLYYETEEFSGKYDIETLESPYTYILKSSSNETLSLTLIKKVSDPKILSVIEKEFEVIFGK